MMLSWFFLFTMLFEPKKSGFGIRIGLIFGVAAGLFSFLMFKFAPQFDIFVTSLVFVNIFRIILECKNPFGLGSNA